MVLSVVMILSIRISSPHRSLDDKQRRRLVSNITVDSSERWHFIGSHRTKRLSSLLSKTTDAQANSMVLMINMVVLLLPLARESGCISSHRIKRLSSLLSQTTYAQANSMMINKVVVASSSRTRTGGGRFFGSDRIAAMFFFFLVTNNNMVIAWSTPCLYLPEQHHLDQKAKES
jgi:hypothetical protein